jgi:two-component system, chemotaxis family, protein-glutamate methylesterase/glutaminase
MGHRDIIAIGGSLGAIDAVRKICRELAAGLPATLFIVIHIGKEGRDLLASIFDDKCPLTFSTASEGEIPRLGHAYVAPADRHLLVVDDVVRLGRGPRENFSRPAVDPLFRSIAVNYGARAVGLVLTGLLNDGSAGLSDIKRCGGVAVVQDPADAVAPAMPLGALNATAVDYRTPLAGIPDLLTRLVGEAAGPAVVVPDDIKLEVDIALGGRADTTVASRFADPVALTCPSCGGVLSQVKRGSPLRFRCQVGHAVTAEALASEQEGSVDDAVRMALRIIEERALLSAKLAEEARSSGRNLAAAGFEARARECRAYVETLRSSILRGLQAN